MHEPHPLTGNPRYVVQRVAIPTDDHPVQYAAFQGTLRPQAVRRAAGKGRA